MDLKNITSEVCKVAIEGGKFLKSERLIFDKNKIEEKDTHDYVSYVDKETEKILVKKLTEILPQAGFITEEGTADYAQEDYYWVIDPLDGTTNYIQDYAPYCVSIALMEKGEFLIGVVYEVCRDECFYAWKDGGAHMNGKRISVSDTSQMNKAFAGLDLPYNDKVYKPVINYLLDSLYGRVSSVRFCGSAAMALCFVAIGRYDMWAEAFLKLWDFAAGALIVQEAGGKVSDFAGITGFCDNHYIVASNNKLHSEIISLTSGYQDNLS